MTTQTIASKTFTIGSASFEMIKIKGGTFWMGDDNGEYDEKPAHKVFLDSYMLAQYPVTQALWYEVMKDTDRDARPSFFQGDNRPVERVNWEDAIVFCNELSRRTGLPVAYDKDGNHLDSKGNPTQDITKVKGFRLPTEAEWEYAAIGGHLAEQKDGCFIKSYEYAGSKRLEDVGWYRGNSNGETKDVGLKLPNRLGLYDMSGNVWERCWDWYDDDYYQKCKDEGIVTNPTGGKGSHRVYRGGSWFALPQYCRVSDRGNWALGNRYGNVGFRLVCPFQSVGSRITGFSG